MSKIVGLDVDFFSSPMLSVRSGRRCSDAAGVVDDQKCLRRSTNAIVDHETASSITKVIAQY
jgi:hypothetical protein